MPKNITKDLVLKALKTNELSQEEIVFLLKKNSKEGDEYLFLQANLLKEKHFGKKVWLRGIIEFSNFCQKNCLYCGLRKTNEGLERYRLPQEVIFEFAKKAIDYGNGTCSTIVLQSGEDEDYPLDALLKVISDIRNYQQKVAVTVSMGLKSEEVYRKLKKAGAERYLMKQETSSEELFASLRPGTQLKERLAGLRLLRKLGFVIGSGMMVGLPGQMVEDLANDILLLKNLGVEMAGIGPFIAHFATPLKNEKNGDVELTLRAIAISRLLMPEINLPATTALGTLDKNARQKALSVGANVIMPNVSPQATRKLYAIYPEKMGIEDEAEDSYEKALEIIQKAGLQPVSYKKVSG